MSQEALQLSRLQVSRLRRDELLVLQKFLEMKLEAVRTQLRKRGR